MNKKSFVWSLVSVLILASLALTACGTAATPAPTAMPAPTTAPVATTAPTAMPAPTTAPASNIDCKGAKSGDTLSVVYQWSGNEEQNFNTIIKPLVDACGIKINAQSTRDAAVLDTMVKSTPPDVLFWPDLSPIKLYSDKLMPMDTDGADVSNYASDWITLGTANGKLYALPAKSDMKTLIWYSPAQFQALGYTVPTTFADLQTLVDKMASDGNVPWAMGLESGAATGWTGADFIEDILLATQGTDYVNGIISGKVPYNDPGVMSAYQIYQKWASDPKYTVGGSKGTVSTNFNDAILQVFSSPPKAMMVDKATFAAGSITQQYPNLKLGTDYNAFAFPGAKGVQVSADFMYAFSNSPAAQALIAYWTSDLGGQNFAATNWGLSANKASTGHFTDPLMTTLSNIFANASGYAFSTGDAIGDPYSTAQWKAVVNVAQGQDIKTNLDTVAAAQTQSIK
ncbi:MAG: extracellular solute-binding protein [Anaerolineales bacterium]